jgi:hypothetical protein
LLLLLTGWGIGGLASLRLPGMSPPAGVQALISKAVRVALRSRVVFKGKPRVMISGVFRVSRSIS